MGEGGGLLFEKFNVTSASPAYWRYESTQKVIAVVLPNEHPKLITPKKNVGIIHLSPTSADHPKPINPRLVQTATGIAMTSRNSGSYTPSFILVMKRTMMSLTLPATTVPRIPPV